MESNFSNREFEQFVKTNADQYRMIPSEKVWRGINSTLHTRRRWYGFGLTLLLLLTVVSVTWVMVSYPDNNKQQVASNNIQAATQTQTGLPNGPSATKSHDITDLLSINKYSQKDEVSREYQLPSQAASENSSSDIVALEINDNRVVEGELVLPNEKLPSSIDANKDLMIPVKVAVPGVVGPIDLSIPAKDIPDNRPVYLVAVTTDSKGKSTYYPLTIESVVNAYHKNKLNRQLTWQLYFTPTVSYRKWSINKSYHGPASPFSVPSYPFASLRDVNSEVVHKPDMGLELGLATKYPITRNLRLTGGLQFNINRYDIKAFAYSGEQATINLSGGNGNNSVTAWTNYRNYNGYKSDWLKNFYFSVSAPIGAELRLLGNDKTNFGIAGTLQPTYILKDRAFLISSDYKNYVEMPRLVRHVNLNTSFETFISYLSRNGRSSWQIGPQVRYQALSSFQNKYPVKENLFDFGLKVGLSF